MSFSSSTSPAKFKLYNPCHPERTLLYQTIADLIWRYRYRNTPSANGKLSTPSMVDSVTSPAT